MEHRERKSGDMYVTLRCNNRYCRRTSYAALPSKQPAYPGADGGRLRMRAGQADGAQRKTVEPVHGTARGATGKTLMPHLGTADLPDNLIRDYEGRLRPAQSGELRYNAKAERFEFYSEGSGGWVAVEGEGRGA